VWLPGVNGPGYEAPTFGQLAKATPSSLHSNPFDPAAVKANSALLVVIVPSGPEVNEVSGGSRPR
jgi:hypothetical protein